MKKTALDIIDVSNDLAKAKIFDSENITKESIALAAQAIAAPIIDGQLSPSKQMIKLMALRDILEEVISTIKPEAMTELALSKGSTAEIFGAKIEPSVTAKYDYSNCGHSGWETLDQQEKSAKEAKKKIEAMLKTLSGKIYMEETGEEIMPPKVTGGETIKVTFKAK